MYMSHYGLRLNAVCYFGSICVSLMESDEVFSEEGNFLTLDVHLQSVSSCDDFFDDSLSLGFLAKFFRNNIDLLLESI
jgi:hypothetical protein